MRVRIDERDTRFVSEETDAGLLDQLDDFLNFFEFVAYLENKKELFLSEVQAMFDYSLRKIAADTAIAAWLRKYGYEQLDALLRKLGYSK